MCRVSNSNIKTKLGGETKPEFRHIALWFRCCAFSCNKCQSVYIEVKLEGSKTSSIFVVFFYVNISYKTRVFAYVFYFYNLLYLRVKVQTKIYHPVKRYIFHIFTYLYIFIDNFLYCIHVNNNEIIDKTERNHLFRSKRGWKDDLVDVSTSWITIFIFLFITY